MSQPDLPPQETSTADCQAHLLHLVSGLPAKRMHLALALAQGKHAVPHLALREADRKSDIVVILVELLTMGPESTGISISLLKIPTT